MNKPKKKQEAQETQEQKPTQEALEVKKSIGQNAGGVIQTPFGPATLAAGSDLTAEEIQGYIDRTPPGASEKLMKELNAGIFKGLLSFSEQPDMEKITAVFPDAKDWTVNAGEDGAIFSMVALTAVLYYIDVLPGYLEANGIKNSLESFATQIDPETGKTLLMGFLDYQENTAPDKEKLSPEALNIIAHRPKYFDNPRDRVNDNIFDAPEVAQNEVLEMYINTNPKDKKNEPYFYYTIDFDTVESEVPFVRRLTAFDKRLALAFGALTTAGNEYFTIDQLFRAMGHSRNAKQSEKDAINASLTKMHAITHIDNKAEIAAAYNYKSFEYDGPFLAFERVTGVKVNGKESDTVIHAFRSPFILALAGQRNELQRIPINVLQSDINRSDFIMQIEDYIMGRISDFKRGYSKQNKILYATMYERLKVKADDRKAKKRMRDYVQRFLQHCKEVNWIKDFKVEKDSVTFSL